MIRMHTSSVPIGALYYERNKEVTRSGRIYTIEFIFYKIGLTFSFTRWECITSRDKEPNYDF